MIEQAISELQQLGFGQYEARAYVALLQKNPVTGYELAKASGIPRPNIYRVLNKLEERGAVLRIQNAEGTRYAPVEPEELISRLRSRLQDSLDNTQFALERVSCQVPLEQAWNINGYPLLLENAREMIDEAKDELSVAAYPQETNALNSSLQNASERGVKITTLCLAGCAQECANCRGKVYRYPISPEDKSRWLVIILDQSGMIAGEISPENDALALRTTQKMFVNLAARFIHHNIALAAILMSLGDRLKELVDPETRKILESIGPGEIKGGWINYMQSLLKRRTEVKIG